MTADIELTLLNNLRQAQHIIPFKLVCRRSHNRAVRARPEPELILKSKARARPEPVIISKIYARARARARIQTFILQLLEVNCTNGYQIIEHSYYSRITCTWT